MTRGYPELFRKRLPSSFYLISSFDVFDFWLLVLRVLCDVLSRCLYMVRKERYDASNLSQNNTSLDDSVSLSHVHISLRPAFHTHAPPPYSQFKLSSTKHIPHFRGRNKKKSLPRSPKCVAISGLCFVLAQQKYLHLTQYLDSNRKCGQIRCFRNKGR